MNFIRRLNRGNFVFETAVLKFGDLLLGLKLEINTKFQHNVSKFTPVRPKKYKDKGFEYHYS